MPSSLAAYKDQAFVAVLGLTGSGKILLHQPMLEGKTVHLIDTPGFDDTYVSDIDRLQELALYLTDLYKSQVNLTAIIYLQDIRVERIGGIALKNIRILESVTGLDNFGAVTIATNFWTSPPAERSDVHEAALRDDDRFFGPMLRGGARYWRLPDWNSSPGRSECLSLLEQAVLGRQPVAALQLQRELVDQGLQFGGTLAGQVVMAEVERAQAHNLEKIRDLETKLNETLAQVERRRGSWLGDVFRAFGRAVDDCIIM
ncbi:hypothetical protein NLU13_8527 [Sarocladium strictum]|uniref:G domain-containing protein n=1 Tax=Sarocladium strictum TaxID=5046 RepID=A0AA39GC74_SARSR|nr:hypothetical protein NLU13_8527 [Sarocladium strictum]